jgi:hypothetical protein
MNALENAVSDLSPGPAERQVQRLAHVARIDVTQVEVTKPPWL